MANPKEDNLTPEDLDSPFVLTQEDFVSEIDQRQNQLLSMMSRCTTEKCGCASGDAWVNCANEFYGLAEYESEQHELAALAVEEANNGYPTIIQEDFTCSYCGNTIADKYAIINGTLYTKVCPCPKAQSEGTGIYGW